MARQWDNPEAEGLLREIMAWVTATGSTSGQLGQMALNHPGFVPLLIKRGTLKAETADHLHAFMEAFPDRAALPSGLAAALKQEARVGAAWAPARHRSLMMRLGYCEHPSLRLRAYRAAAATNPEPTPAPAAVASLAGETGGGKPRVSAAVIRAAALDGRDLPTFVTALIEMGLECWRDDRIAGGEEIA